MMKNKLYKPWLTIEWIVYCSIFGLDASYEALTNCPQPGAESASKVRGAISATFGSLSQVSSWVRCCKRVEVYIITLLWQNNERQNGVISRMLFSDLYKIMVNEVTFVGFRGVSDRPLASATAYNNAYRMMHDIPRNVSVRPHQVNHYARTFDALFRNYLYGFVRRCEPSSIFLSDHFRGVMLFANLHFSSIT